MEVEASTASPSSLAGPTLSASRAVILCDVEPASEAVRLADRCHELKVPVFVASSFGLFSFLFVDLGENHSFTVSRPAAGAAGAAGGGGAGDDGGAPAMVEETRTLSYPPMSRAIRSSWAPLKPRNTPPAVFAWAALHMVATQESKEAGAGGAGAGGAGAGGAGAGAGSGSGSTAITAAAMLAAARQHCVASGVSAGGAGAGAGAGAGSSGGGGSAAYVSEEAFEAIARSRGVDFPPAAAVAGGVLGNEIVKLISGKDEPIHNLFVFDSLGGTGGGIVTLPG